MTEEPQPEIGPGAEVVMHFAIRLEDGMEAESSFDDEPIRFTMGDGTLIEGLEMALLGLKAGDHHTVRIGPETAYGYRDPDNVHEMPRDSFPADMALEPGVIVGFTTPGGDELPGSIVEASDESVTVDLNHPLAGHEITFEVQILEVHPAEPSSVS